MRKALIAPLLLCATMHAFAQPATDTASAPAQSPVFEGYDAFYASLPDPLFASGDLREIRATGAGDRSGNFWSWTTAGRAHALEVRGADLIVDGRRLPAARATRFEGEGVAPSLGRAATVYANADAVCVEGVPGSASGTAVRHVRVSLVTRPYGASARRFELPSLFASCLGLFRRPADAIGFYRANYRWPENASAPLGVTFDAFVLKAGAFERGDHQRQATFVEPGNVYRFTSP